MSWLSLISKLPTWQGGPLAPARMAMSLPSTPSGAIPGRCQGRCEFARSPEKLDKLGRFGKSWETSESFRLNLLRSLSDLRISRQMTEGPHQRQTLVTYSDLRFFDELLISDDLWWSVMISVRIGRIGRSKVPHSDGSSCTAFASSFRSSAGSPRLSKPFQSCTLKMSQIYNNW